MPRNKSGKTVTVTAVTMWPLGPQQDILQATNTCISISYIIIHAPFLCGHMVTAVTVWPFNTQQIYPYVDISICISACYTCHAVFLALCGHMVTAVTVWPFITQQFYPYIDISICISVCYTYYTIFLTLCGHMVTAVTMWPCDRDCNRLVMT